MARLIDADALIERWDKMSVRGRTEFDQEIMVAPSIAAVEVVRGEWIYDANGYDYGLPAWKCNRCGCINANIPPRIMTKESKPNYAPVNPYAFSGSNFCPNCGAKMKGADDE